MCVADEGKRSTWTTYSVDGLRSGRTRRWSQRTWNRHYPVLITATIPAPFRPSHQKRSPSSRPLRRYHHGPRHNQQLTSVATQPVSTRCHHRLTSVNLVRAAQDQDPVLGSTRRRTLRSTQGWPPLLGTCTTPGRSISTPQHRRQGTPSVGHRRPHLLIRCHHRRRRHQRRRHRWFTADHSRAPAEVSGTSTLRHAAPVAGSRTYRQHPELFRHLYQADSGRRQLQEQSTTRCLPLSINPVFRHSSSCLRTQSPTRLLADSWRTRPILT